MRLSGLAACGVALLTSTHVAAQSAEPEVTEATSAEAPAEVAAEEEAEPDHGADLGYETIVVATRSRRAIVRDHRAVSVVGPEELAERAPRTTPEALHMVPGVSVQKTNHAGGAPFIRGRTGQQTLFMIDGFRLNTSIMRSGPNQYLITIDPTVVHRLEVLRGSGSVLYGSDAIGGVVNVVTRSPAGGSPAGTIYARGASADRSAGGRVAVDSAAGPARILAGVSGRHVGDLRGGGPLVLAEEPVYEGDRQLFTGYDELAGDAKVTVPVADGGELTAATYVFRQLDAPRTDKCSPEPLECRWFDEQFYDLAYLRYADDFDALEEVEAGVAFARTHEMRRRVREARDLVLRETDDVFTVAATGRASLPAWRFGDGGGLRLSFGAEAYADFLGSAASTEVMSTGVRTADVRGKYLDGSTYLTSAAFAFGELVVDRHLSFTAGARLSVARAGVARDPEGGTAGFSQVWATPVVQVGARLRLARGVHAVANVNQGFRAPNLDDLTARSDEGPGFQLPNDDLDPETSVTIEGGLVVDVPRVRAAAYAYQTYIDGAISRDPAACPPELVDRCGDADAVFRLVNADESRVHGVEVAAQVELPAGVRAFGTLTWTVASRVLADGALQPESKIPPLHGRGGVRFAFARDYFVETIAHWAMRQDRLSPADLSDARIPPGGTPAYGVVDVRAGARISPRLRATLTLENLFDVRYRVHGSGVDGAGFGIVAAVSGTVGSL